MTTTLLTGQTFSSTSNYPVLTTVVFPSVLNHSVYPPRRAPRQVRKGLARPMLLDGGFVSNNIRILFAEFLARLFGIRLAIHALQVYVAKAGEVGGRATSRASQGKTIAR